MSGDLRKKLAKQRPNRSLGFIFEPKGIAVIGASEKKGKVGNAVLNNVITSGYKGNVFPINNRASGKILGITSYKSVLDVEEQIDVAIICIPSRFVLSVMEEIGKKKIPGCVVITAGFKEIGEEGMKLEKMLVEKCREYNIRCIGPNCLGFISQEVNCSFTSQQFPRKGGLSMISQSGAMMTAILDCVSIGNKADLDEVDLIMDSGEDPDTKIITCYVESVSDGQKFLDVIPQITTKKPVVILKSGRSAAGRKAASSHTGALAQDDKIFTLAFRKTGVIRAYTMEEFFNLARCFTQMVAPQYNKFVIVTNAGGPGIVATDSFSKNNIKLSEIPEEVKTILRKHLPHEAALNNPIDVIGDATPDRYENCLMTLFENMDAKTCSGALILVTPQSQTQPEEVAKCIVRVQKKFPDRTLIGCFMGGKSMKTSLDILSDPCRHLNPHKKEQKEEEEEEEEEEGEKKLGRIKECEHFQAVPSYMYPENAVQNLKYVLDYHKWRRKYLKQLEVPPSPTAVSIPIVGFEQRDRIEKIFRRAKKEGRKTLNSYETSEVMTYYRINNPTSRLCKKKEDISKIGKIVGYPIAMKISSPDIIHKSDCGGVKLWVKSDEEAEEIWESMMKSVKETGPKNARLQGIEMQQMVDYKSFDKVVEMIVGMTRDPTFGPVLMVGQGGKYANYLKDVRFALVHEYNWDSAVKQLEGTKVSALLKGVRKDKPSDITQLIGAMCKVAKFVHAFKCVQELDLNPLVVFERGKGVCALDIKITLDLDKVK